jgi:hypothetical protein
MDEKNMAKRRYRRITALLLFVAADAFLWGLLKVLRARVMQGKNR